MRLPLLIAVLATSCASTDLRSIDHADYSAEGAAGQKAQRGGRIARSDVAKPPPDPSKTREVGLEQLLAYANHHAPALALARAGRALAKARGVQAGRLLPSNPRLEAAFGPRVASGGSGLDVGVSLSQEIEIAGQRGLRRQAAERFARLVERRVAEASWRVRLQISTAFCSTVVARERQRIAREQVAFSKQLVEAAKRRLKAGDISPLKLKLAEMEVEQAGQSEISAGGAYARARIQLAALAGWPTATPPVPRGHCGMPRSLPQLNELLARSRSRQPALATRREAVAEARARVAAAARSGWSNPAIGVSYAREGDPGGGEGPIHVATFTLGIDLPLWPRNLIDRAAARADLALAQAQLRVSSSRVEGRVRAALGSVEVAARRMAHFGRRILPRYRESLRLLRRAFELGEVDLLQVFVARGRLITGQLNFIEARGSYCRALLELESLVGRIAPGAAASQPAKGHEEK